MLQQRLHGRQGLLPAALFLFGLTAGSATAFPGLEAPGQKGVVPAFDCRDLSLLPESGPVDYVTDIQAGIFDSDIDTCSGCHGAEFGFGGLGLAASVSYESLVCAATSTNTPGAGAAYRVVPFKPEESWLFLRVNCFSQDDMGFRMPQNFGGGSLFSERQRLIYDWIAQGAQPDLELPFGGGFESELCPELPDPGAR